MIDLVILLINFEIVDHNTHSLIKILVHHHFNHHYYFINHEEKYNVYFKVTF